MKLDTKAIHSGQDYLGHKNSISTPIYPSTAFCYESVEQAINLFDLKTEGDMYSRISNPTNNILDQRINALEGGVGALTLSSGQSALLVAVLNIVNAGDEIISSPKIYGGSYNLLGVTLKRLGITARFIDLEDISLVEKTINDKTKLIFTETLGNPNLNIADIEALSTLAHKYNIPLIVDNTVASPYLCRPFEFGADIVIHSTTKYLGGHGYAIGGAIVDSGNFDWSASGKFTDLTEPDESYHGIKYTEKFGKSAYITKARVQLLRDFGCCSSPFNSFLTLQGIETLHLRMERHSQNALKVAQYLESSEFVKSVSYPGLKSHKYYNLAQKYLPNGQSSLVGFEIKGGIEKGIKFIESLKQIIHVTNIGDIRSLITYPAGTTHRQMSDEELQKAGISKEFMRLSVGIEDVEDIIADIEQALKS